MVILTDIIKSPVTSDASNYTVLSTEQPSSGGRTFLSNQPQYQWISHGKQCSENWILGRTDRETGSLVHWSTRSNYLSNYITLYQYKNYINILMIFKIYNNKIQSIYIYILHTLVSNNYN